MKRLNLLLGVVVALTMVFTACEIDDISKPVINLLGDEVIDIALNDPAGWTDPGFTASDDQDGDLTHRVLVGGDSVDVNKIGMYEISYSVVDDAGNSTIKKRTVNVIVDQSHFVGSWDAVDVINTITETYTATITASSTNDMLLLIENFSGFGATFVCEVEFDKFGVFTINTQPLTGSGYNGDIVGTGSTSDDGQTLTFDYDLDYQDGSHEDGTGTWTKK